MSETINIRDMRPTDEADWRGLWDGYNSFYETSVAPDITSRTWQRMLDPASPLLGRMALVGDTPVGFSLSVLHEGTWVAGPICYLEDLFVDPACRGRGIGRTLIRDLVDRGTAQGWATLYWHTRENNPARRLYDEFVKADDFVRYRMQLQQ
ncbi:ribosomal protein S18 acetylase RimI-like enzyme [Pseudochelatococcus lubricantis]|uniref:Ribosomal protein S18 acetylase RimI-like enzyme n=2 Tax=Pseudochelatococcus lubricantis TaxID=1538102 RepID=A0ABX0V518_9HYPH|nr:ribosomal protein S18 acetylase RimI-like enzyme [Pseudochelatococcus lubricantis]